MFHEPELNTLIGYSYFGFQTTDLEQLLKQRSNASAELMNLRNYRERVDLEINACFLGFLEVHDSTYLMYAYIYDNKEYGFVWDTANEELLTPPKHNSDMAWFVFIKQGQSFKIKIIKSNPYLHYIIEKPFALMNGPVLTLGPCRDVYPDNNHNESRYAAQ
jgi:hypothetical protein